MFFNMWLQLATVSLVDDSGVLVVNESATIDRRSRVVVHIRPLKHLKTFYGSYALLYSFTTVRRTVY